MPPSTKGQERSSVITHDLVEGIIYVLITQGWPGYAPDRDRTRDHRYAFDLSMWQAYLWLRYRYVEISREDEIHFTIRPHWMYGDSPEVRDATGGMLGFAFVTWTNGGGVFDCRIDADTAERMLERNSIDRVLLDELTRRFRWEYGYTIDEREWPPSFDFEKEFRRQRKSRELPA